MNIDLRISTSSTPDGAKNVYLVILIKLILSDINVEAESELLILLEIFHHHS